MNASIDYKTVNKAFSRQSLHYDAADAGNPILQSWRKQVYDHLEKRMSPNSTILELNSGTGIDAFYLASKGHSVHCTDLSDGMVSRIEEKIRNLHREDRVTCQQCSFDELNVIKGQYDLIFSNFGGLNCIDSLKRVTHQLPGMLRSGGMVTFVVMPVVSLWELSWILKGDFQNAFRRFNRKGTLAHVEGEYFRTYYHSLREIRKSFDGNFKFIASEGVGAISPPASNDRFPMKHPDLYRTLTGLEKILRHSFPFNRYADHLIVSFRKR